MFSVTKIPILIHNLYTLYMNTRLIVRLVYSGLMGDPPTGNQIQ